MTGNGGALPTAPVWRRATPADLDAMMVIQDTVHTLLPERREVFANKLDLFGAGCHVLVRDETIVGYGIAHPWLVDDIPPLDTVIPAVPDPADCLFLHDVALMSEARGQGAGRAFVALAETIAQVKGWRALALISVYDSYPAWSKCGFRSRDLAFPPDKRAAYGDTARYMTAVLSP